MQMYSNDTNSKLLYPKLSYRITGVLFKAHNVVGRFGRENQYCDWVEKFFIEDNISYQREFIVGTTGNRLDFLVEHQIIVEAKAKDIVTREDYYQIQRYLHILDIKLGILVNFRQQYLHPKRIVKTQKDVPTRFH